MSLLQSILMGIIQGATEFLPVSSSGHLALFKIIFNVNTETGLLFDTMLHLGTLVAVCIVYWKDVCNLIVAAFQLLFDIIANFKTWISNKKNGEHTAYRRLINSAYKKFVVLILITTIPTGIMGVAFSSLIERASQTLLVPGICLVITAILLLISDTRPSGHKKVKKTTYANAAVIGVAQGLQHFLAFPFRNTITACLMLGFDRAYAVKYSFLISLPAILGANILELRHFDAAAVAGGSIAYYFIGMIVAGVVGYICIKLMIYIVRSNKFQYFAYYCAVVGIIAIIAYFVKG